MSLRVFLDREFEAALVLLRLKNGIIILHRNKKGFLVEDNKNKLKTKNIVQSKVALTRELANQPKINTLDNQKKVVNKVNLVSKPISKPIDNWKNGQNVITKPVDVNQKVAKIEKLVNHTYKQKQIKNKRILFSVLGIGAILLGIGVTIPSIMFANKESIIVTDKKIAIEWEDEESVNNEVSKILNGKEFVNVFEIENLLNEENHRIQILTHAKNNELLELKQIKVEALEIIDENEIREYEVNFEFELKDALIEEYEILGVKTKNLVVSPKIILTPINVEVDDVEILKNKMLELMPIINEEDYKDLEYVKDKLTKIFELNKDELIKHFSNYEVIDKIKPVNLRQSSTKSNLLNWDFDLKLIPKGGYDFLEENKTIELTNILIKKGINVSPANEFGNKISELIEQVNLKEYSNISLIELKIENLIEENFELLKSYFVNGEYIEKMMIENLNNSENQNWNFDLTVEVSEGYILNNEVEKFKIENVIIEKLVELNFDKIGFTNKLNELEYIVSLNDYNNTIERENEINNLITQNFEVLKNYFDNNEVIEDIKINSLNYLYHERWSFKLNVELKEEHLIASNDENMMIENFLVKKRVEIIQTNNGLAEEIKKRVNLLPVEYVNYNNIDGLKMEFENALNDGQNNYQSYFENGEYIERFEVVNLEINGEEKSFDVIPVLIDNHVLSNNNVIISIKPIIVIKSVVVKLSDSKMGKFITEIKKLETNEGEERINLAYYNEVIQEMMPSLRNEFWLASKNGVQVRNFSESELNAINLRYEVIVKNERYTLNNPDLMYGDYYLKLEWELEIDGHYFNGSINEMFLGIVRTFYSAAFDYCRYDWV